MNGKQRAPARGAPTTPGHGICMKYNRDIHHRRSIRLNNYDYTNQGAYFVTICTCHRECLFGEIKNSHVELLPVGEIVNKEWNHIHDRHKNVELDAFVVMPNHIHGIIIINEHVGAPLAGTLYDATGALSHAGNQNNNISNKRAGAANRAGTSRAPARGAPTLGDAIGSFKSLCTYRCRKSLLDVSKLWQRNYYEHVIRNDKEMNEIRFYIQNNPLQWDLDNDNPRNIKNQ